MLSPDVHDRSTAGDSGQKRAETATVDYDLPLDRSDLVKASLPSGLSLREHTPAWAAPMAAHGYVWTFRELPTRSALPPTADVEGTPGECPEWVQAVQKKPGGPGCRGKFVQFPKGEIF